MGYKYLAPTVQGDWPLSDSDQIDDEKLNDQVDLCIRIRVSQRSTGTVRGFSSVAFVRRA